MRFALIDNRRIEAEPKLRGLCPCCSQPVTAKCGKQKVWHWAHLSNEACDNWLEPETEWHRIWKDKYPAEWQEISLRDESTGERHIADVRTVHNLVLEFQHSHIDPQERISREKFYKNMVWVVDGTRLKRDYTRFRKGCEGFMRTNQQGVFIADFPEEVFPANWIDSSVPVIFDFSGTALSGEPQDAVKNTLWCLLPENAGRKATIVGIGREDFIKRTHDYSQLFAEKTKERNHTQLHSQMQVKRREPTHYYDPRKGGFKKKWRF